MIAKLQKSVDHIWFTFIHLFPTLKQKLGSIFILSASYGPKSFETRFGPNRPAADMEGYGEFHFWVIFGDIFEDFLEVF